MTAQCLADRRFNTDTVFHGISADGSNQLVLLHLIIFFKKNFHDIVHSHFVRSGSIGYNGSGLQHPLQITDAALVLILMFLGCIILKVLT